MILAKFSCSWADEFDCDGFMLMTEEQWEEQKKLLARPQNFWFGTNEGFEAEVLLDSVTVATVTHEEVAVLRKLFPELNGDYSWSNRYGIFPFIEDEDEAE